MAILIRMMAAIFTYKCPRCGLILQFDRAQAPVPTCSKCKIKMVANWH